MALFRRKKFRYAAAGLLIVVIVIVGLQVAHGTHFFHKASRVSAPGEPIAELPTQTAANKNPSGKGSTLDQGTTNDKNGQIPGSVASSNSSRWATSASGLVTLETPLNNATLTSGDTIAGTASSGPVQYTLVDNQVGVISQGSINVVNGKFAAVVNFRPYASSGRLDVFNTEANGREINEVEVTVNF